ncbi:hypothetical protein BSL82_01595 [Tardibacter chloracetimidivorans]|uniref:Glutathione S-transferase n=1 Tax=Tardibacter chloracetimidivorans TaxID=1921510 RepID=A0A1L3ZRA5_9SPHN|nr:hypothetical protein BSL82_01595 [Tardibacter chloracetimidivorans]
MTELTLHFYPGACSRATMILLEEAVAEYATHFVDLMQGAQKTPEYLAVNPKGKVPTLVVDGRPLTENVAIISWLNKVFPEARLLPGGEALDEAKVLSDLAWVGSTVHIDFRRCRMPRYFIDGEEKQDEVRALGLKSLAADFGLADARLAERPFWHGDWSAMDAYLFWVWRGAIELPGFDAMGFRNMAAWAERVEARPATQRGLAREKADSTRG